MRIYESVARKASGDAGFARITIEDLLDRLELVRREGKGWKARCPAHKDRTPSLSISEGRDGRILLNCFAGCRTETVAAALGLTMADLFPSDTPRPSLPPVSNGGNGKPRKPALALSPTYLPAEAVESTAREIVALAQDQSAAIARRVLELAQQAPEGERLALTRASEVHVREVRWVWKHRIPLGDLALCAGLPGLGKTTLAVELAARLTRGELSGDLQGTPVPVLFASAEDSPSSTLAPRLHAAGANLDLVYFVEIGGVGGGLVLPNDTEKLRTAIVETGAKLVVIDPLNAFIAAGVDSHKDQSIRSALAPLHVVADDTGCAVFVLGHLNKHESGDLFRRVGGSIGLTAAARSVLLFGRDPDAAEDADTRVLVHGKCNVGPLAPTLRLRIESRVITDDDGHDISTSGIVFMGESGATVADVLGAREQAEEASALDEAVSFLWEALRDGPVPSAEIEREANRQGIPRRTLFRARSRLGVVSRKAGFGAGWVLQLPEECQPPTRARGGRVALLAPFDDVRGEKPFSRLDVSEECQPNEGWHSSKSANPPKSANANDDLALFVKDVERVGETPSSSYEECQTPEFPRAREGTLALFAPEPSEPPARPVVPGTTWAPPGTTYGGSAGAPGSAALAPVDGPWPVEEPPGFACARCGRWLDLDEDAGGATCFDCSERLAIQHECDGGAA